MKVYSIKDSYKIRSKSEMICYITEHNISNILNRSVINLVHEWRSHNLLYDLNLYRARTKDVDFEFPQKWYYKIIYRILSLFYYE